MTIKQMPYKTELVEPVKFDVSIYPVSALLTATGVQYLAEVANATTTYADLFSISTHTYFPYVKGDLAWAYFNISFEVKGGSATPIATYKVEVKNSNYGTWVIQSAEATYQTTTAYVGMRLEGYILITAGTVDNAPLDIRLQFKSDAAGATETVTMKLKNDTCLRLVGSRDVR